MLDIFRMCSFSQDVQQSIHCLMWKRRSVLNKRLETVVWRKNKIEKKKKSVLNPLEDTDGSYMFKWNVKHWIYCQTWSVFTFGYHLRSQKYIYRVPPSGQTGLTFETIIKIKVTTGQFLLDCRKTKPKVITLVNHRESRISREEIKTPITSKWRKAWEDVSDELQLVLVLLL